MAENPILEGLKWLKTDYTVKSVLRQNINALGFNKNKIERSNIGWSGQNFSRALP